MHKYLVFLFLLSSFSMFSQSYEVDMETKILYDDENIDDDIFMNEGNFKQKKKSSKKTNKKNKNTATDSLQNEIFEKDSIIDIKSIYHDISLVSTKKSK